MKLLASKFERAERRACRLLDLNRSTCRYVSTRRDDLPLRQTIRAIAQARPRFGYRRVFVMLKRQGWHVGSERVRRLYREEGLSLRLRPKRRRKVASHLRVVAPPPQRPRERWSMDFMVDSFIDGRRFRVLTVVDIFSRHSPIIEADTSLNGTKVVAALERAAKRFGYPQVMQVDNVLNASLLSSKSDSHPRRLAGAFDAIKTVHTTVNQWSSAVVGSLA